MARFNFLAMDRPDLLYSVKALMRKMASPRATGLIALYRVARYTVKYPRMACRYRWTALDSNIEVVGDANVAGCTSTTKFTVGGVALWSNQFVKAWSTTMGVLALSSGESELAAVVRQQQKEWETFGCWRWMDSASRSFGENSRLKMSGLENPSDAQRKYLGPAKTCKGVPVDGG